MVRHGPAIGDDIVDERRGGAEALEIDHERRRPIGKHRAAVAGGEARQVDDDVDLLLADQPRHLEVHHGAHVGEAIEDMFQTRTHGASVACTIGNGVDLEAPPIVPFDQPGEHVGDRVFAKIRREVG